jgi:DNA-binding transcriptional regulator YiaG
MMTDNNNDGLEIPAHLKREPKAKPAAQADALNVAGATPGASQVLADEADAAPRKRKAKDHRGQELGEYLKQNAAKAGKTKAAPKAKAKATGKAAKPAKAAKAKHLTPRKESKQALFIEAMRTAKGISITEAAERFGWQQHTVRGAVAGAIKTKLKLKVDAEHDEKRGTVYRIK